MNKEAEAGEPQDANILDRKIKLLDSKNIITKLLNRAKWSQRIGYVLLSVFTLTVLVATSNYFIAPWVTSVFITERYRDAQRDYIDQQWRSSRDELALFTEWVAYPSTGIDDRGDELPRLADHVFTYWEDMECSPLPAIEPQFDGNALEIGPNDNIICPQNTDRFIERNDGTLTHLSSEGDTWQDYSPSEGQARFFGGGAQLENGDLVFAFTDGTIYRWRSETRQIETDFYFSETRSGFFPNGIFEQADGTLFLFGTGGVIYVRDPVTASWTRENSAISDRISHLFSIDTAPLLAVHSNGWISRRTDDGEWVSVSREITTRVAAMVRLNDDSLVVFGGGGFLVISHDSGETWHAIASGLNNINAIYKQGDDYRVVSETGSVNLRSGVQQTLEAADDLPDYQQALNSLPDTIKIDEGYIRFFALADVLSEQMRQLDESRANGRSRGDVRSDMMSFLSSCQSNLPPLGPGADETGSVADVIAACTEAYRATEGTGDIDLYRSLSDNATGALLLLFFLTALTGLYRYNLKLSGLYNARADTLTLLTGENNDCDISKQDLNALSDFLAAEHVEFKEVRSPTQDLADTIRAGLSRSP
jgi:hypothetical protein